MGDHLNPPRSTDPAKVVISHSQIFVQGSRSIPRLGESFVFTYDNPVPRVNISYVIVLTMSTQMGFGIPTPNETGSGEAGPVVEVSNDSGNPLPVSGTVSLSSATLAALETITVLISSGQIVGLDAATLAALENIVVSGTVALDAPTLAALESITATVSNFPADYPDAAVLAKVEAVRALLAGTLTTQVTGSVEVVNDIGNPLPMTDNAPEFWRIKNQRFTSAEEVRYDIPASLASGSIYTGVAADGTSTASAVWTIIRTYFDANGNPNRERIRTNVAWDSRTAGWT